MSNASASVDSGGDGPDDPRDAMTRRNQLESPLLRLPAELRNEICKLVLGNSKIYFYMERAVSRRQTTKPAGVYLIRHYGRYYWNWIHLLSLTQVCRQLHQETQLLPFQLNKFDMTPGELCELLKILEPKQLGAIGSIQVNVNDFSLAYLQTWGIESPTATVKEKENETVLVTTQDSSLYHLVCPILHNFPGLKHLVLMDVTKDRKLKSLRKDVPKEGSVLVEVRPE